MKILISFVLISISLTVYSQNNGMFIDGIPYNQNSHFMFSLNIDTIINGTWTQLANYPHALFGVNCYFWPSTGKIFTCGGATDSGVAKENCYYYNTVSNTYETADSLPEARWSGKLVRIKDSLYLIGSASNFLAADGNIYKYSPVQNQWLAKATMPSPKVHEPAVCVFKDSLIICIGGSTSSFAGNTNIIRIYNPYKNTWKTIEPFPISTTTGHAECNSIDSTIVVVGGYGATFINVIYYGKINYYSFANDSIGITWQAVATTDTTIFHTGIYRVGGGMVGNWMLFGPALRNSSTYNTVYAVNFSKVNDTLRMFWYRMVPNIPDSAGNRPTIAVNKFNDSVHIYLFSGSKGLTVLNTSYKYSFVLPVIIGIKQISGNVPDKYKLFQNYPNPFNPSTRIKFDISNGKRLEVKLVIYDVIGREVSVPVNESLLPGSYEVEWRAANYSSGIYFYRIAVHSDKLTAEGFTDTKKMVLIK